MKSQTEFPINRRRSERGGSVVEMALMSPWIFFLFIGIFDLGFYTYASICVQNAALVAAAQTSTAPGAATVTNACQAALGEMNLLPNHASFSATCGATPLVVTQNTLCGSTTPGSVTCKGASRPTSPACADCSANTAAASSQVSVTYQTIPLVPIPGLLTGRLNLTRIAEMRILVQ